MAIVWLLTATQARMLRRLLSALQRPSVDLNNNYTNNILHILSSRRIRPHGFRDVMVWG